MKIVFIAVLLTLLMANTAFAQEQQPQEQMAMEPQLFWGIPFPNPGLPPMAAPKIPSFPFPSLPPLPSHPNFPSFPFPPTAASNTGLGACLKDLESFIQTHKFSISSECCSVLKNVQNPLVQDLVKNQCASASSPPSA